MVSVGTKMGNKKKPTGETRKNWKSLARYHVHPAHIVPS